MSQRRKLSFTTLDLILFLLLLRTTCSVAQGLKGGHHKCLKSQEGQFVSVKISGGITVRCKCLNEILDMCQYSGSVCQKALEGCHFVEESTTGICPTKCKGCYQNDTYYASGESWISEENNCQANQCFSGVITQSVIRCPKVWCSNPVQKPGQCCLSCPECSRGLQPFARGETNTTVMNPCDECTCSQDGHLHCITKACPALPCHERLHKKEPGKCCPVCARQHESISKIKDKCVFKGKVYNIGSNFEADSCTNCTCNSALTVSCQRKTCLPLPCDRKDQEKSSDQCCPTCSKSLAAQRPSHCTFDGKTFRHGQTWEGTCIKCSCNHGETKCKTPACASIECPANTKKVFTNGDCCAKCEKPKKGVCTVFGDPHYKTFDGRIFNFQGSCKYLLARDCAGGRANSTFSIRITNDARNSMAFSWLRTVTVRLEGGYKISLMQKMKVKVNGKRVTLPYVELGQFGVTREANGVGLYTMKAGKTRHVCHQ